jgi:MYXO-CTERM domain-containing protein
MTLPGEVMSTNAQHTEGQTAAWEVALKDTDETFVAIADVGSLSPLLLVLAAVAGAAFLIRRRSQPRWSEKADQGEVAEDR